MPKIPTSLNEYPGTRTRNSQRPHITTAPSRGLFQTAINSSLAVQAGSLQLLEHCLRGSSEQLWRSDRPDTPGRTTGIGRTSERLSAGCHGWGLSHHPSRPSSTPQQCCFAGGQRTALNSGQVCACFCLSTAHGNSSKVHIVRVRHNAASVSHSAKPGAEFPSLAAIIDLSHK